MLPSLERTFIRHADGLNLIRQFLSHVYAGRLGRGIICCDSWAWAFLQHVWQGRLPAPLVLQASDQGHLIELFQILVDNTGDDQLHFRQSDNGDFVLPTDTEIEVAEETGLIVANSKPSFVLLSLWLTSLKSNYLCLEI